MGVLKPQWVIGITFANSEETELLDNFIEQHPKLFTKSKVMVNGYINYVMFWDGSKEYWDDSNEGDALRKQFLELLRQTKYTDIYEIERNEGCEPSLKYSSS